MTYVNWMMQDMNSFFASAEQFLRPELRKRAVGVVPLESDATCIIAASYEAKRCGVRTGTKVYEAKRLCPHIQLVRARPNVYVEIHHDLLKSVDQCAEVHHVYSIDEWTIRLCGRYRQIEQAVQLAGAIKRQLRRDFGPWLTSSIGIAPTRLLAKTASNLKKPDGLTVLPMEELPARLSHLSLEDLPGLGRGMVSRLNGIGVYTLEELWKLDRRQALQIWGSVSGARWWDGLHGIDEPEPPTQRHSMSHGRVLDPRFRNEAGAHCILVLLLCKLARRLRQTGYYARSLQLTLSGQRGALLNEKIDLPCVQDTLSILHQFERLWLRRPQSLGGLKKVDVTVSKLERRSEVSGYLFDEISESQRLSHALDEISDRWGPNSIYFANTHAYRDVLEDKIAFGRIPELVTKRSGFHTVT
ncbi:DNA polymerase IV [Bremerella volcania]|uniref:DNA polymerase IV n=1 Tax=Bremerella volcania TaxID=2527984 RepID=A0A518CDI3_9BACT|nr:type VI secretion protein ImpB [Bremerella volcania]QDU77280.1 DNA polymerase IV [Bremerella volcania]